MTELTTTRRGKAEIAKLITFDEAQIQLMKDTVAKGATDNEFKLFMHLAQSYGLDPFLKEIWCLKYGSNQPATVFTSRDGYLKIASRDPQMDGIQSDVVYANDRLTKLADGTVEHAYGQPDRGLIVGAYALVFRKDRSRPAYFYAPVAEYNAGNNPTWKKYPSAMIVKVAEAMALKRAFSISGLVTQEELGLDAPPEEPETSAVVVETPASKKSQPEASAPASAAPAPSTGAAASGETMAEQLEALLEQIRSELQSNYITRIERGKMLAGLNKLTLKTAPASLAKIRQTCEERIHPDALAKARLALRSFANANATALGQEEYNRLHMVAGGLTVVAADLIGELQDAEEWLKMASETPQQAA
jgi:phage recombination protein Bet